MAFTATMPTNPDAIITKRLHISGITPTLTGLDISKRLSTFGLVTAVDGFGDDCTDGLGQKRKFGYVTIQATAAKLAKCTNLLSGSTWKGAKLRIGDAKPDYRERLAKERLAALEPPKKRQRRHHGGVEAADMSLVTAENAVGRGGWKVTPLGRIVRPIRMRPEKPLPETLEAQKPKVRTKGKGGFGEAVTGDKYLDREVGSTVKQTVVVDGDAKRKKKRDKIPDTRARRRTIDPTKYASTHLKGMFVDIAGEGIGVAPFVYCAYQDESDDSERDEMEVDAESEAVPLRSVQPGIVMEEDVPVEGTQGTLAPPNTSVEPTISLPATLTTFNMRTPNEHGSVLDFPETVPDIAAEKSLSLSLLQSMFASSSTWSGREDVLDDSDSSDAEDGRSNKKKEQKQREMMKRAPRVDVDDVDAAGEVEEVPMEVDVNTISRLTFAAVDVDDDSEEGDEDEEPSDRAQPQSVEHRLPEPNLQLRAKDLFSPLVGESNGATGFTLLDSLDRQFEYGAGADEELEPVRSFLPLPASLEQHSAPIPSNTNTDPILSLHVNTRNPLFFPHPSSFPATASGSSGFVTKAKSRDLFDVAKESGWDPRVAFVVAPTTSLEEELASHERDGCVEDHPGGDRDETTGSKNKDTPAEKGEWEAKKKEMTKEWQRRAREAGGKVVKPLKAGAGAPVRPQRAGRRS